MSPYDAYGGLANESGSTDTPVADSTDEVASEASIADTHSEEAATDTDSNERTRNEAATDQSTRLDELLLNVSRLNEGLLNHKRLNRLDEERLDKEASSTISVNLGLRDCKQRNSAKGHRHETHWKLLEKQGTR